MLAERGIDLSYETVRRWSLKFGRLYAQRLRRLRPGPSGRRAALKLMRKLMRKQGFAPEAWITDKLPSYGASLRNLGMTTRHITGGRINNRAKSSHVRVRQRERRMLGFKMPASAQRFLSTHSAIYNTFNIQRHLISRPVLRILRDRALDTWQNVASAA